MRHAPVPVPGERGGGGIAEGQDWEALAGHLSFDICMLSLNSEGLTDDRLELALSNVPQQAIVLLEDIDAAFVQRKAGEAGRGGVSFSGLLNGAHFVALCIMPLMSCKAALSSYP